MCKWQSFEKIKSAPIFNKTFAEVLLVISVLAVGLFYEYLSCAASVAICVGLIVIMRKKGRFVVKIGLGSAAVGLAVISYGLAAFWAVDSGMAVIGFFKFLPAALYALLLMQSEKTEEHLLVLPAVTVFMTVVSGGLALIPALRDIFAPAGRLAGFFMYSNTFALVCLVCVIIISTNEKRHVIDYVFLVVLLAGIILSGSRTVFVLTVVSVVLLAILTKDKKLRLAVMGITAVAVAGGAAYAFLSGSFDTAGRFLTTAFGESTFVGRLLYYYDALPLILKNPFGTGYLGWYYLQQSVQTGLYSVRYVHNDFLQLALDVGWIPALLFIAAAVRAFFRKGAGLQKRLLLGVMTAHCMFDFDMQFVGVLFIYMILLDCGKGNEYVLKWRCSAGVGALSAAGVCSLYMTIALFAAWVNGFGVSSALYPFNTDANVTMLTAETDEEKMNAIADRIISQNKYVTIAYSAKAAHAFSLGDFTEMIQYKEKAIANAPLICEEYENYIFMLAWGKQLYLQSGDTQSAEFCDKKIRKTVRDIHAISDRLSPLGRKINDQPRTEISEELSEYVGNL